METIKNPWIEFKKNIKDHSQVISYILKEEQEIIAQFNSSVQAEHKIHTDIMPCPYMGNVNTAPIVLLLLNPGYDTKEKVNGFYTKYNDILLEELVHNNSGLALPLFSLEENYKKDSPYWYNKLKPIHDKVGIKVVAHNLCKIQFFPYITQKYKGIPKKLIGKYLSGHTELNSQRYNFELVKNAIKRNAIIIITRGKKLWLESVPELETYPNVFYTVNARNPSISIKNCPKGFPVIESILTAYKN
jgi:hypothetical protein